MQKNRSKNTQYSRNETIVKIDHFGKSIAQAKWAVWVQIFVAQKDAENHSTRTKELFCAKKPLEQTANIREIRTF